MAPKKSIPPPSPELEAEEEMSYEEESEEGEEEEEEEEVESDLEEDEKTTPINADGTKEGKISSINGNVTESETDMDDMSDDEEDYKSKYPFLIESFDVDCLGILPPNVISFVKENLDLIDSGKAKEWEEKWKRIRMLEAELFLDRINLIRDQAKLVVNAGKKG